MAQPIEFGGEVRFSSPPEKLYALVTDLKAMQGTIPDLVSAEMVDDRTMKCVVRPGFSFLRGTMRLTISLAECKPSESATMRVAAQGIGVGMEVVSHLNISPDAGGSLLIWTAKIEELKGLIAAVSPGLITAAADQVIKHAWEELGKRMKEEG